MNIKSIIKLCLIFLWMGLIFFSSAQDSNESKGMSNRVIIKIAETRHENKEEYIEKYTFIVRKTAHFLAYFVLGILVYMFLKDYIQSKRLIISTILICFLYASSDEFHQLFVNGRSGEIRDILIDTTGGLTSTIILYIFNSIRNRIQNKD